MENKNDQRLEGDTKGNETRETATATTEPTDGTGITGGDRPASAHATADIGGSTSSSATAAFSSSDDATESDVPTTGDGAACLLNGTAAESGTGVDAVNARGGDSGPDVTAGKDVKGAVSLNAWEIEGLPQLLEVGCRICAQFARNRVSEAIGLVDFVQEVAGLATAVSAITLLGSLGSILGHGRKVQEQLPVLARLCSDCWVLQEQVPVLTGWKRFMRQCESPTLCQRNQSRVRRYRGDTSPLSRAIVVSFTATSAVSDKDEQFMPEQILVYMGRRESCDITVQYRFQSLKGLNSCWSHLFVTAVV